MTFTDLYAVYDERDGTIVHVHGVPSDAGQSPEDIIAMVDPQQERPLRGPPTAGRRSDPAGSCRRRPHRGGNRGRRPRRGGDRIHRPGPTAGRIFFPRRRFHRHADGHD